MVENVFALVHVGWMTGQEVPDLPPSLAALPKQPLTMAAPLGSLRYCVAIVVWIPGNRG